MIISHFGSWLPRKQPRLLGPHHNPGLELIYVAKGEVTWDYAGIQVTVRPPAMSFSLPWQEHSSATPKVPSCELYWVLIPLDRTYSSEPKEFCLHPDLHVPDVEETRILSCIRQAPYPVVSAENLLAYLMPTLVGELEGACDPMRVRSLVTLILAELTMAIAEQPMAQPPPTSRHRVRTFVRQLATTCKEPWTLDDMADACGLGRTQFAQHLKSLTGDSPIQLLNRLRVDKACALLATSDADITEIAFRCGFINSQYFAKVFREYTGGSASQWRKSNLTRIVTCHS